MFCPPRSRSRVLALALLAGTGCSSAGGGAATDTAAPDTATSDSAGAEVDGDAADTADAGPAAGLTVTAGAAGGDAVSGSYRDGAVTVRFDAVADGAGAAATVRDDAGALLATATVSGPAAATLSLAGVDGTLSGHGALTTEHRAALRAFAARPEARALARGLLELGCVVRSEDTAAQRAALVFVWQLILKHDASFPAVATLEAGLDCRYFGAERNVAAATPGQPEGLILANDDRFPWVAG